MIDYGVPYPGMPKLVLECGKVVEQYCFIILPKYKMGSLLDLLIKALDENKILSPLTQSYLARQIVHGLYYLHKVHGTAHLDVKVDNLVIDSSDCTLKFIDFGSSSEFNRKDLKRWCSTI